MLTDKRRQELKAKIHPLPQTKETDKVIGENLKMWRMKAHLTQEDVAEILGLEDRKTIQRYEKGESECPRETLIMMSQLYGCKTIDFLPKEIKPYFSRCFSMSPTTLGELQAAVEEISQ